MALHELQKIVKGSKRVGRGIGSTGAKSGRGMKGQRSRAGYSRKAGFEGGQTPLYMRLPKARGSQQSTKFMGHKLVGVPVHVLNRAQDGSMVGTKELHAWGVIDNRKTGIKLIGNLPITKKVTVRVHAVTAAAQKSVEAAGGRVIIQPRS